MKDIWKQTIVTCNYCGKPLPRADVICKGKRLALCADCLSKALSLLANDNAKRKVQAEYEDEIARRNWGKHDWRSDPITEKQKKFIEEASKDYKEFHGTTKGEAFDYINDFLAYDKKRREEDMLTAECTLPDDWGDKQ